MKRILTFIVISQFFCTSLWFAGNSVFTDIIREFHLQDGFLAHLTSAVQFGFISGTFLFALLSISDRFSPSRVFFACSVLAALANMVVCINGISPSGLLLSRFLTGFFLAGIYPVGMKIASDYTQKGLGKALGFLVGALVLGTAFPHLLKTFSTGLPWRYLIFATSLTAVTGGLIILLGVPDGPFRKPAQKIKLNAFLSGFRNTDFRSAAFGYFGHMWELYTFWAFLPLMLSSFNALHPEAALNVPLLSFLIIASGGLGCVFSGQISQIFNAKNIAFVALLCSGICCVFSPFVLKSSSAFLLLPFLFFWGTTVAADSPMFSTLVASSAPHESRGTSLTIVNCIGFAITIVSIQVVNLLISAFTSPFVYMVLVIGPLLGLIALRKK